MGSKVLTIQETETKAQQIGVEGGVETLIAPEAVVGGPGTVSARDSTVISEVSLTGYQAGDVQALLSPIFEDVSQTRGVLGGLAESLIASQAQTAAAQQKTLEAVQAPAQTQTQALIPVLIVVAVLLLMGGVKL